MNLDSRELFWDQKARELLLWSEPWTRACPPVLDASCAWFTGAALDVSANCLDRHISQGRADVPALIWQGEPENDTRVFTYAKLLGDVTRAAVALAGLGVTRGDVVGVSLPALPELPIAMLALARLGAVHLVFPAGLSPAKVSERLDACGAKLFITADGFFKAGQPVAVSQPQDSPRRVLVRRTGIPLPNPRADDLFWSDLMEGHAGLSGPPHLPGAQVAAHDPLFILYTSGSSGHPKGVVHTAGGFLTSSAYSAKQALNIGPGMTVWCLAEPGWIMGHAYAILAPLTLGATTLLFEGSPSYPKPDRIWRIAQRHRVATLVTTPALTGQLMREGAAWPAARDLPTLTLIASVGEKLTPENRRWLTDAVGKGRAPVVDAWGQTETGGALLFSSGPNEGLYPLPGADAAIDGAGRLVLSAPWPGLPSRLIDAELPITDGRYDTGDMARQTPDGAFIFQGRSEFGSAGLPLAQVEAAAAAHPDVAEAAAVAGNNTIVVYVTLRAEALERTDMAEILERTIRLNVPEPTLPLSVRIVAELPKTRSGKIARKALRQAAEGQTGDISNLADPSVMDALF